MNAPTLHKLRAEARALIDEEFLRGERGHLDATTWQPYVEEAARPVSLERFDKVVDQAITKFAAQDTAMDAAVAPELHQSLPLTRREASDPGVWRYLTVVRRPDFVRHRWAFATHATTLPRYWQLGTRPNSNAFARLWWIAELTVDDEDGSYRRTKIALSRQPLATAIFVRSFSHYKPAVNACLDVLRDAPAELIAATLRRVTTVLTTTVVEGRSTRELAELIVQIRQSVEDEEG